MLLVEESLQGILGEGVAGERSVSRESMREEILKALDSGEVVAALYRGAWEEYPLVVREARREGLNPYLYTPIDRLELTLAAPVSPSDLVAAKYSAALASMADKALTRLSPSKSVDRRTLLFKPLQGVMEYVPAPILLNPSICGSWRHCRLCLDACPHNALEGKPPMVDASKCTGCGVCSAVCPFGLLFMPQWNVKALTYMLDRLRKSTDKPGVIVGVCDSMLGELSNHLEGLDVEYPVVFIHIHCPGWLTEFHMLEAALSGFDVVIACSDDRVAECRDGGASERWLKEMEPLGAYPAIIRSPEELAETLASYKPRSRPLRGVEHLTVDKTAAYSILEAYGVEEASFSTPIVGYPEVDEEKCLLCEACSNSCPYGALRLSAEGDEFKLVFDASKCTACGACEASCPYGALRLSYRFSRSLLGKSHVLAKDEVARCRMCGRPIGSLKHLKALEKKLRESGVDEWVIEQLWLCQECKVKRLLGGGARRRI